MTVVVSAIHIYPLKGARGVELEAAHAGRRGFDGDRRWMVVDARGGFLSQRSHPRLALLRATVAGGESAPLWLEAPGLSPLEVPAPCGLAAPVRIWNDTVAARDAGDEAAAWLSAFLGEPARLAHMADDVVRPLTAAPGGQVSFADAYPYLLLSAGSLADLNRRLAAPLPMDRFRPNLVVDGCTPFAEDGWRRLRAGRVVFRIAAPCARCTVTTVDQATGERGAEPLRTLATYRQRDGKIWFGQNLIAENEGPVRRGDPVEVIDR